MQGWISLHRKITCHPFYQEKRKFSKFEAWIDLLLMVNHETKKVLLGNELIEVKRGQRITSIRQLCDRWGWSNSKVTQYLKLLESDGMITVKSDTKKTVITIDKYSDYQQSKDDKTTENRHENDTKQTRKHTNNNDNNENKNIYADVIDYLNEKAGTKFKHTTKKTREYIQARLNEKFTKEDMFLVIDYCCTHWKGKIFANGNKGDDYLQPSTLFNNKFDERLQKALKDKKPNRTSIVVEEQKSVIADMWSDEA